MARRSVLLHLVLACALGGAWALRADNGRDEPKKALSPEEAARKREALLRANQAKTQAQAEADGRLRQQRLAALRPAKEVKPVSTAKEAEEETKRRLEEEKRARLKKVADEMAALRPLVQAQKRAERLQTMEERKRLEVEDSKRSAVAAVKLQAEQQVRLQAMQEARDQVYQELQAKMQDARDKAEKARRKEMLRAKWRSILAAKEQAERDAFLPEVERQQLADARAQREAAELARQHAAVEEMERAEEKKRETLEREKNFRAVQRLRQRTEQEQMLKAQAKARRIAEYENLQRLKEKRAQAAQAKRTTRETGSELDTRREDSVLLTVRPTGGEEMQLRISNKARLQVLLATAAQRLGIDPSNLSLSRDGSFLSPGDVVGSHRFQDGDVIHADAALEG